MVAVGFKAKWSASFLVTLLSVFNVFINNWYVSRKFKAEDSGGAFILLTLNEISLNTICESRSQLTDDDADDFSFQTLCTSHKYTKR
jgi:hypothetical protein